MTMDTVFVINNNLHLESGLMVRFDEKLKDAEH
jgi:hypothetical protein